MICTIKYILKKMIELNKINKLIQQDMLAVNKILIQNAKSEISLINKLSKNYIINGGKRIRPIITLLSAKAINYQGIKHITIAALIEFIHAATLLHDDVIDKSKTRRGKSTINSIFGDATSILIGDFIYTKAFQIMTDLGSMKILSLMSESANIITQGEILQLINQNNPYLSEKNYMKIIYSKTARLFEVAAQSSAIIADKNIEEEKALQYYGRHIGNAYQIIDDVLDYTLGNKLGKQIGHDFYEGKITLPLLHAIKNTNLKKAKIIQNAIKNGNSGNNLLKQILETMNQCKSIEWTQNKAKKEAKKAILALKPIKPSIWKKALKSLATILIKRRF